MLNVDQIRKAGLWVIICIVVVFILSSNIGGQKAWNPAEQIIVEIIAPVQKIIQKVVRAVEAVWLRYFDLVDMYEENQSLKRANDALRMQNNEYRNLVGTSRRLDELQEMRKSIDGPVIVAQVIGKDPDHLFEAVLINKGSNAGLKRNMPVINAQGVVGRLVAVSPHYAKVLLIIDQNSAVDCIIERSRENGIIKGLSSRVCKLEYFVRTGDVVVGDQVVSSGLERIYPKGLPVGTVTAVVDIPGDLFRDVKVAPAVDFSKLEELMIILKEDPLLSP